VSARLAAWIYRWRIALTVLIAAGAIVSIPRANITHIDNDITAGCSTCGSTPITSTSFAEVTH